MTRSALSSSSPSSGTITSSCPSSTNTIVFAYGSISRRFLSVPIFITSLGISLIFESEGSVIVLSLIVTSYPALVFVTDALIPLLLEKKFNGAAYSFFSVS
jgi:hypothetical protein